MAIRIIGIDPGLRRTGWGVVETIGNALRFVAAGTVRSDDKDDLATRLRQLHDGLTVVIRDAAPAEPHLHLATIRLHAAFPAAAVEEVGRHQLRPGHGAPWSRRDTGRIPL